jgi:hypothetical protein
MGIDKLAKSVLQSQGLGGSAISSSGNPSSRIVYPAIVITNEDPLGMKRIIARIISLDEKGNVFGGKDRDTPDDQLPMCVPMIPNHFHIIPQQGEMVYLILENPEDNSAPRYYIGAQINSPFKLQFQQYVDANRVFNYTSFSLDKNPTTDPKASTVLPQSGDIALQGRVDADLILKYKEAYLVAGKFEKDSFTPNSTSPAFLQISQLENPKSATTLIPRYSQTNLTSTNVNIYSVRGKFRESTLSKFEINEDLKSFGELANSLHPSVFGDELVKLLDLIVKVMLNHIHTPQKPLVTTPDSEELSKYTVEGNLQRILSNHIRIN